jgi:hypothetical protein
MVVRLCPALKKNGSRVWVESTYRSSLNENTGIAEIVRVSEGYYGKKSSGNVNAGNFTPSFW